MGAIKRLMRAWLIMLAAVLSCPSSSQAQQATQRTKPDYASVFMAMIALPEGKVVSTTYFNTFGALGSSGLQQYFSDILDIAQNNTALATYFWPVDSAWTQFSYELCMSVEKIQDTLKSAPQMAAAYMKLIVVPGKTIFSKDFKNGDQLQTMDPRFTLNLTQQGGRWIFPGLALNNSDVAIVRTNITAGASVIHFVDAPFFNDEQRGFWLQQRTNIGPQACEEFRLNMTGGAGTVRSTTSGGSGSGSSMSPAVVAGIIVPCVVAAAALVAVVVVMLRRKQIRRRNSAVAGACSAADAAAAAAAAGGKGLYVSSGGGAAADVESPHHLVQHTPAGAAGGHYGGPHMYSSPESSTKSKDGSGNLVMMTNPTKSQMTNPYSPSPRGPGGGIAAAGGVVAAGGAALQPPFTQTGSGLSGLPRSVSGTAGSEGSGTSASAAGFTVDSAMDEQQMAPVFEANPVVADGQLSAWLSQCLGRSGGSSGSSSSGGSSSRRASLFAEQLRKELDPAAGNPNIIHNYTNFSREVEHSTTAVYFCEGMHSNRQFALKFYAQHQDFVAERDAYSQLGGPHSKYIPTLEMTYPGSSAYPTSVLVFERGQCTLETFAQQRPSYFQQIDIFHQLLNAVQHLHDHGVVHRDMKPSNVVHFPQEFAWKLIDLATVARVGEDAKIVYTREYVSPEVAQAVVSGCDRTLTNPASDMWGIGVIMYELATGHRFFPREWSADGGRRIWAALCGFEPLPSEQETAAAMRGVDRGLMRQVRKLLQRDPGLRPTPRQLLAERLFQARGNTTTQVSQGSNLSHGSGGSGAFSP